VGATVHSQLGMPWERFSAVGWGGVGWDGTIPGRRACWRRAAGSQCP
jgi:hypothetical protein